MKEPKNAVRSRGPRGGGADTRAALLAAAKAVFAESGFATATVRTIAGRAGVDPAMVNHWFGSKQGLFTAAVLDLPFDLPALLADVLAGDPDTLAERLVRTFLKIWDANSGQLAALMRSVTNQSAVADALRELFAEQIFGPAVRSLGMDQPLLRAALCGSQMIGLGMVRYVLHFEPIASAGPQVVVATVAPTIERYLRGQLYPVE